VCEDRIGVPPGNAAKGLNVIVIQLRYAIFMVKMRGDGGGWSMNRSFSALSLLRAFYGTAIFVCAVAILGSQPTLAADLVDAQDADAAMS
jgi:hypothetical protein